MLLYIHIPFCQSKCPYCAFGSVVGQDLLADDYFNALCDDLKSQISNLKKVKFKSVFIGGGTPSAVDFKFYEKLFAIFKPYLNKNAEITVEANPNSVNKDWLIGIKTLGVNRISFGVQSFYEDKLKLLGRTHSIEDVKTAVKNAKIAGFKNINIDIIYSTKLDNKKRLKEEISQALKLKIKHISAYSLTLEEKTPFENKFEYKKDSVKLSKFIINELNKNGFKQYEISNFGKICKHNLGYWQADEYIGIGAYSVGFYSNKRLYASKNLKEYIKDPLYRDIEILNHNDLIFEKIFLGARSCVGINKKILNEKQNQKIKILKKAKKVYEKDGIIYIKNFLLADEIALFITSE